MKRSTRSISLLCGLGFLVVSTSMMGCVRRSVSRERTLVSERTAGDAAYERGEYSLAAGHYERYLEERPARREVMYDLGRAYEGMGEMSAAREAYTLAYELDPFKPEYIDAMARAAAANGEIEAAFDLLEGIARESDRSGAYARLGAFLLEFGFPDEGVLAYRTAAEVDPSGEAYVELARVYRTFDERQLALDALAHALWFDPGSPEIRAMVRDLGGVPGPTFARKPRP